MWLEGDQIYFTDEAPPQRTRCLMSTIAAREAYVQTPTNRKIRTTRVCTYVADYVYLEVRLLPKREIVPVIALPTRSAQWALERDHNIFALEV